MSASGLELPGIVRGEDARLRPDTRYECGVCWAVYDPGAGDPERKVPRGTPLAELPDDWRCPSCDHPRERFLPLPPLHPEAQAVGDTLAAAWRAAEHRMRGLPIVHPGLSVEAVGFQPHGEGVLGIVITPWVMNLVLSGVPGADRPLGSDVEVALPAGRVDFAPTQLDGVDPVLACSVFSPMDSFADQAAARAVAWEVLDQMLTASEPS